MSVNQKRAWGNIIVWGSFLVASAIALSLNGTFFFWQEDALRNTFYAITGAAFVAWFVMMLVVWLTAPKSGTTDERDNAIMSRVNAAAGPIAMTAVAASALALMIVYLEDKSSLMSPYFLIYIIIINVVVYWLAQAINTLIAYRRS
jgi:cytochrome bd-type quinol oxidase subunit 2